MAVEDILASTEYVTSALQKIRAAVALGDVHGALQMLAMLQASPHLERISELNMGSGKGLTFRGAVDFAISFLSTNNQIQALQVLAGQSPTLAVPGSPERTLFDAALFEAKSGNFRKAKDALAGISGGSRKTIMINNQQFTLDQALAYCHQALDKVRQSKEAQTAVSWLHYVKEQL